LTIFLSVSARRVNGSEYLSTNLRCDFASSTETPRISTFLRRSFGYVIYVRPDDYEQAANALGV